MIRAYFIIALLLLTGCAGGEFEDLREFVKNSGADMRGKIEPPPDVKPYEYFQYNNDENLPSPFEMRKEDSHAAEGAPDLDRPKEALEEYPLENLTMVGFLSRNKVNYAVIRAPDQKLHRVQAGNYIGLNFGLIKQVSDAEVVIREVVQDSAGLWTERMSSILLQE
jgi:type IV pilus assembly protein PilP